MIFFEITLNFSTSVHSLVGSLQAVGFDRRGVKGTVCFVFIRKETSFVEGNCGNYNSKDWKMDKIDKQERLERTASMAYNKGLINNPGENNCFLNSAVQVRNIFCLQQSVRWLISIYKESWCFLRQT